MDSYVNMQLNKKNERVSPSTISAVCAIIILIGGFFLSYNYIKSKKIIAYDYMASVFYNGNELVVGTDDNNVRENETAVEDINVTNEYIGYLNIPKINLNKGFLSQKAPDNNVEKNITVIEGSTYPNVDKGNLIIAGHSGTGWKAFFNDLYKLNIGDIAKVTFRGKTYTYKITNIYTQEKVGTIAIYRDYDKTTLTLVTCTNNSSTTQTIYIAELESVE